MEFITLFLIAVALSMDAFAVSISNGLCYSGLERKHVFQIAGTFGFFQAFMPLLGYFLGQSFKRSDYFDRSLDCVGIALRHRHTHDL
jgi:manganese efflux pump family protein